MFFIQEILLLILFFTSPPSPNAYKIHVKYTNTLTANNDNTTITILDGIESLITPSSKLQKTLYKVGSALKIKRSRSVNIEIGYDFGKSKKYHSHTGYVSAILPF